MKAEKPRALRVGVIGARQARQGTGPWLARAFHQESCELAAILGRTQDSLAEAAAGLSRMGMHPQSFTSLETMLAEAALDVLVIASPTALHGEHLQSALAAGIATYCEKPLLWSTNSKDLAADRETLALLDAWESRQVPLRLGAQWPWTLPAFYELYPELTGQPLTALEMGLSPVTLNPIMIADAAPHILSLLDHSLGEGTIGEARFEGPSRTKPAPENVSDGDERAILRFNYHHSTGTCRAALHLKACPKPPRPAWFSINGAKVERQIKLPDYAISFRSDDRDAPREAPIEDPLRACVRDFIDEVQHRRPSKYRSIRSQQLAFLSLASFASENHNHCT